MTTTTKPEKTFRIGSTSAAIWKRIRDQHATAQTMLPRMAPCPTSLCRWSCPVGFANPALVS